MNRDVTKTDVRCPRAAEHRSEKNVHLLRYDHDGSHFCPVHGAVDPPTGHGPEHFNATNGDFEPPPGYPATHVRSEEAPDAR